MSLLCKWIFTRELHQVYWIPCWAIIILNAPWSNCGVFEKSNTLRLVKCDRFVWNIYQGGIRNGSLSEHNIDFLTSQVLNNFCVRVWLYVRVVNKMRFLLSRNDVNVLQCVPNMFHPCCFSLVLVLDLDIIKFNCDHSSFLSGTRRDCLPQIFFTGINLVTLCVIFLCAPVSFCEPRW